jgi:hypothetical protein
VYYNEQHNNPICNGVCAEELCPYDESKQNTRPSIECDIDAKKHPISSFGIAIGVDTVNTIKSCLVTHKPVMCAFGVYASFLTVDKSGVVPLPYCLRYEDGIDARDAFLGGHEAVIIGYDDTTQLFELVNSWGVEWGDNGFFYLPYAFIQNNKLTYELSVLNDGF